VVVQTKGTKTELLMRPVSSVIQWAGGGTVDPEDLSVSIRLLSLRWKGQIFNRRQNREAFYAHEGMAASTRPCYT